MASRPFEARYRGRCAECPRPVREGDSCVLDDGQLMHETCYQALCDDGGGGDDIDMNLLDGGDGRFGVLCTECNMFHAGECF